MPAHMPGDRVKVTSLVSGHEVTAVKLRCKECGKDQFCALLIGKRYDLHLQCIACGTSHCAHDSECHEEERPKRT